MQGRLLKIIHTVAGAGLTGGLAAYMLVLYAAPETPTPAEHLALRSSLATVAKWLIAPSMLVTLTSGLLAMALRFQYIEAPWVWAKALSGILIFEATLGAIDGPAQEAAVAASLAVAGEIDAATLASRMRDEWFAWWTLLGLSVANVVLAILRPRFGVRIGR